MLRRSRLPTPPAEINYNEVAKQKKDFGTVLFFAYSKYKIDLLQRRESEH